MRKSSQYVGPMEHTEYNPERFVIKREELERLLGEMPEEERYLIEMKYGLRPESGGKEMSLEEMQQAMPGVSPSRLWQLLRDALEDLRALYRATSPEPALATAWVRKNCRFAVSRPPVQLDEDRFMAEAVFKALNEFYKPTARNPWDGATIGAFVKTVARNLPEIMEQPYGAREGEDAKSHLLQRNFRNYGNISSPEELAQFIDAEFLVLEVPVENIVSGFQESSDVLSVIQAMEEAPNQTPSPNIEPDIVVGDMVAWRNPMPDESPDERYLVKEVYDGSAIIELAGEWKYRIRPTQKAQIADLVKVGP